MGSETRGFKTWWQERKARKKVAEDELVARRVHEGLLGALEPFKPTPEVQFGIDLAKKVKQRFNSYFDWGTFNMIATSPLGSISHDLQFSVDDIAEKEIKDHFENAWEQGYSYGYASEEQGLVLPPSHLGEVKTTFLIDLDGSRMIQRDLENGTLTMVGVPGHIKNPTFSDIEFAISTPINDRYDRTYYTKQINGSQKIITFSDKYLFAPLEKYILDPNTEPGSFVWETYSADPEKTGVVLRHLLSDNNFSVTFPSGSYGTLQVVLGQHTHYVDARKRFFDQFSHLPIKITNSAKAALPMDIAAGWFMLQALGGKVTDAYGNDLDNLPLWSFDEQGRWTDDCQISVVAAISPEIHEKTMNKIEEGFAELYSRYQRPT